MLEFVPGWVWGKDVGIFSVTAAVSEYVVAVALEGTGNGPPRSE